MAAHQPLLQLNVPSTALDTQQAPVPNLQLGAGVFTPTWEKQLPLPTPTDPKQTLLPFVARKRAPSRQLEPEEAAETEQLGNTARSPRGRTPSGY
eukprot:2212938-Amphidinium_carterae.1